MKNFKILLLGLIFALVCSVSFAGPPGSAPLINNEEEKVFVSIDLVILPAITIENSSLDDLRQHRSESEINYDNEYVKVLPAELARSNKYTHTGILTYGSSISYLHKDSQNKATKSQYSPPIIQNYNQVPACNQRE